MNNYSGKQDKDKQSTEEAWAKLQSKLEKEPYNPQWAKWSQNTATNTEDPIYFSQPANVESVNSEPAPTGEQDLLVATHDKQVKHPRRLRMNRRRKLGAVLASVAVFAVILATPIGNTAMASILNQFRMEQVTVVHENDLRNIFTQVAEDGELNRSINQFGEFTNTNGAYIGELPADQLKATVGYPAKIAALGEGRKTVTVGASQDITLNLKVDEVNKALKKIGAEHLLPESIDGKPITLHIPEIVNYNLSSDETHWASLSQMNAPVLNVDPSIKVEEALEAVVNFPLLPDYLKTSLMQSRVLSGEIPMPLIAGENTEQITVGDTLVIVDNYEYSQGPVYQATWIQDGQLFNLSGELYSSKEKLMTKVQELIES
ncbi:hypothetical protein NST74_13345 [Paenibacillus sp. FSL F4-0125]|uniref:hypothetical protein n=1 Tax=Paenibacillus sp. FSL F4-0125 TaxID=2954730 RepID=UPI0030F87D8F